MAGKNNQWLCNKKPLLPPSIRSPIDRSAENARQDSVWVIPSGDWDLQKIRFRWEQEPARGEQYRGVLHRPAVRQLSRAPSATNGQSQYKLCSPPSNECNYSIIIICCLLGTTHYTQVDNLAPREKQNINTQSDTDWDWFLGLQNLSKGETLSMISADRSCVFMMEEKGSICHVIIKT